MEDLRRDYEQKANKHIKRAGQARSSKGTCKERVQCKDGKGQGNADGQDNENGVGVLGGERGMNKQEQIEKMAQAMCDGCSDAHKIPPECKPSGDCVIFHSAENAIEAGYINSSDFVEWLKEKYGDLFYEIVLRETGYPYREQVDLDKALQEYLKGE